MVQLDLIQLPAKTHIGFRTRWVNATYVTLLGVMAVFMTVAHAKHVYEAHQNEHHTQSGCHVPGLMFHSSTSSALTTHGARGSSGPLGDTGTVSPGGAGIEPGETGVVAPDDDTNGFVKDCFTFEIEGYFIHGPTGWGSIPCLIFAPLGVCLILTLYLGAILDAICANDWVKEKANFKLCFSKKCKWYNVGCHLKKLFCLYVQFIKWILQLICEYKRVFLFINYLLCLVAFVEAIVYIVFGTLV